MHALETIERLNQEACDRVPGLKVVHKVGLNVVEVTPVADVAAGDALAQSLRNPLTGETATLRF